MKRWWFIVLALALMLALAATASAAPRSAPFMGAWEAIDGDRDGDGVQDPGWLDGSYMRLTIGGGPKGAYQFHYRDFGASVCGVDGAGAPLYAGTMKGRLTMAQDGALIGEASLKCLARPAFIHPNFDPFQVHYLYDPATDTIFDGMVTWKRMGVLDIHP